MKVRFDCPICERPVRLQSPAAVWQCPHCDHLGQVATSEEMASVLNPESETGRSTPDGTEPAMAIPELETCPICGCKELYRKKDFPHSLGLAILTVACLGSIIPYYLYHQWISWAILIGSAAFDGILYLVVGDVVVCYRCEAQIRNVANVERIAPFDLGIGERYRQERIRREHLQARRDSDVRNRLRG